VAVSAPADLEGLPWPPGEPGPLHAAAQRAGALSGQLEAHGRALVGAASHPAGWSGVAESAFDGAVTLNASAIGVNGEALLTAATSLHNLSQVIQQAQQTVRLAAAKLHEARVLAQRARAQATVAQADAQGARAQANSSPASLISFGTDPLSQAADHAEAAAGAAERRAQAAEAEAQHVEQWAKRQAHDAVESVRTADRAAAGALRDAGGAVVAAANVGGGAFAAGGHGAANGLSALGGLLSGGLRFVTGGHGATPNLLKLGTDALGVKSRAAWLRSVGAPAGVSKWSSWYQDVTRLDGWTHDTSLLPTFNNGAIGTRAAGLLAQAPGKLGDAGTWLGDSSKATPFFRGLGVVGSAVSLGFDGTQLVRDGNPIRQLQDHPATYANHLAKTAFDGSTLAFMVAPNPVTGGAVIVSGAAWAGTEIYIHRKQIGHAIETGAKDVWHGAQWLGNQEIQGAQTAYHAVGQVWDQGSHAVEHTVNQGLHVADSALHTVEHGATNLANGAVGDGKKLLTGIGDALGL